MAEQSKGSGARVLLVSTNRERQPYPVVPNGLACVASALDAAGHHVRFLDLCFASDPVAFARSAAVDFKPGIIGVSVRNIDNSDAIALRHYTPEARSVLHALRQAAPGAKVIAGGAAFGVAPEALFRDLAVDYAVAGDGERASVALVDALSSGAPIAALPGLVRDRNGTVAFTPPGEDADLDSLPRPGLHRWIDLARYQRHGATIPIQTKRGCVYKCVYCTYRNVEGWGYRTRDPELVSDEIEELKIKAGVRHFDFVDSTFNSPPGHAIQVCEAITRRRLGVQLDTTNFTPASASAELLGAMKAAGFRSLGITAESASDPVLEKLEKGFDARQSARGRGASREVRNQDSLDFSRRRSRRNGRDRGGNARIRGVAAPAGRRGLSDGRTSHLSRYDAAPNSDRGGRGSSRNHPSRSCLLFLERPSVRHHRRATQKIRRRPSALHVLGGFTIDSLALSHASCVDSPPTAAALAIHWAVPARCARDRIAGGSGSRC